MKLFNVLKLDENKWGISEGKEKTTCAGFYDTKEEAEELAEFMNSVL
ncbi:MAG: hypothetical protein ACI9LM_005298 [Alteromonadaceae bacterium]|jgi:hypothetical protein